MNTELIKVGFWAPENEHPLIPSGLPRAADCVDASWDARERMEVAAYLDAGKVVARYRGWSSCRICGRNNGSTDLSDGTYLWPQGLSHYVREHAVRLPEHLLEHISAQAPAPQP